MSVHVPGVTWSLRDLEYGAYVRTYDTATLYVQIVQPGSAPLPGLPGRSFWISRKDARLLARRLNECLDATTDKGEYGRGPDQ